MGQIRIIAGKWRGRQLSVVAQKALRPTPDSVRETLFNWLMEKVMDARCLDLFAGTGILGFEALSRGAKEVIFIEKHPASITKLKEVATKLNTNEHCQFIAKDAISWLMQQKDKSPFDIIFLDPPYDSPLLAQSLQQLANSSLVNEHTWLYIESNKLLTAAELPATWQILKQKKQGEVIYHLVQGANPS